MNDLNNLFQKWRSNDLHKDQTFITDGPIDPNLWKDADTRILLVAKEAYGDNGINTTWDLPTLVRDEWKGPKHKFWWTAGYWAYGVRNTSKKILADFPGFTKDYKSVREVVLSMAIMNIKKSGGESSSNDEDLKNYAISDGDYIKEEFNILNPHITIFCNTWHLVKHLFEGAKEVSQYVLHWGNPSKTFINYWHPANQYPDAIMFHALCAIYQKSLAANE